MLHCQPCRLKDSPTPYEFPISVIGARPQVAIKLDAAPVGSSGATEAGEAGAGPGEKRHSSINGGGGQRRVSDGSNSLAKAAQKPAGGKAGKGAADYIISYDRLLLGKKDAQTFTISNTGVLPFKWRLTGVEQLPQEFRVQPSEGELAARSKVQVVVEFNALKKQELAELVTLEVSCRQWIPSQP